jgi:hypothetical protein
LSATQKSSTRLSAGSLTAGASSSRRGRPCPGPISYNGIPSSQSNSNEIRSSIIQEIDTSALEAWKAEEREREEAERLKEAKRLAVEVEELRAQQVAASREELARYRRPARRKAPAYDTQDLIREVCDDMRDFLVDKNLQYGDSAIDPVRIFSKADPVEQLYVRIDDKLSRIARGDDRLESDSDVIDDLIGYLLMLKVAHRKAQLADA